MRCSSCQKVISSSKATGDPSTGLFCQECGATKRGDLSEPLGGRAGAPGSAFGYLVCGDCSPEPLCAETAVFLKVRKVGVRIEVHGAEAGVDVLECPRCGRQIIR